MQHLFPSRLRARLVFPAAVLLAIGLAPISYAQRAGQHGRAGAPPMHVGPRPNQEHLAQWMNRHQQLPLSEQQQALGREPGFRDLSPQVQQRMRDRLTKLNSMPPLKRQRLIERTEMMEHLSPQQRQQVRSAMLQLSSLPENRRRAVAHAFHDLREAPPTDRAGLLGTEPYRSQFSPPELSTLSSLIAVEPYLPSKPTAPAPNR